MVCEFPGGHLGIASGPSVGAGGIIAVVANVTHCSRGTTLCRRSLAASSVAWLRLQTRPGTVAEAFCVGVFARVTHCGSGNPLHRRLLASSLATWLIVHSRPGAVGDASVVGVTRGVDVYATVGITFEQEQSGRKLLWGRRRQWVRTACLACRTAAVAELWDRAGHGAAAIATNLPCRT